MLDTGQARKLPCNSDCARPFWSRSATAETDRLSGRAKPGSKQQAEPGGFAKNLVAMASFCSSLVVELTNRPREKGQKSNGNFNL
jgi:hypothetical protein